MSRIVCIDYGVKRSGVAVTDELQLIASGLTTVPTTDLLTFLKQYLAEESVSVVVIGEPKQMNNKASESEVHIQEFIKKLKEAIPMIEIARIDERFTSKMAFQTMIDSGLKKKQRQNKALVDEISATIILQSYLESK